MPAGLCADTPDPEGGILAKASLFREFLMHRICQCADAAVLLDEAGRMIPAQMLTRAVAETTIMLFWLHQKSVEFTVTKNEAQFERFLLKGTYGSSRATALDQACTVLMTVDRFDKEAQGFKQLFDVMCERTDTNYTAAMNTHRWVDTKGGARHRQEHLPDPPGHSAEDLLMACLKLAQEYNGRISALLAVSEAGVVHPREPEAQHKSRNKF